MDPTIIITAINLIAQFLPKTISGKQTADIIGLIDQAVPIAAQVGNDLAQPIRNIIAAMRLKGAVTAAQLDQLDAQEAALDAAFDAAAAADQQADAGG